MRRGPVVSGIGGVFNGVLVDRLRIRALRNLADRSAAARRVVGVTRDTQRQDVPLPIAVTGPVPPNPNKGRA